MAVISRSTQRTDRIYEVVAQADFGLTYAVDPAQYVVTPDGEGRYWYDSLTEAREQHGDLTVVRNVTVTE